MQIFKALQEARPDPSERQIEVHLGSLTAIPEGRREGMQVRQKAHIARIFRCLDPNVDVIYVVPEPLEEEVLEYFIKIMQFRNIRNPPGRLQVVAPENAHLLPNCSLTAALLWSPRAIARIKSLIDGRRSCVVPYLASKLEPELCAVLGAPLFAATAEQASKANAMRLVRATQLPTPVCALDVYSASEFYASFTQLLLQHTEVDQWVFKLEDEVEGNGLGTIDMAQLKMVGDVHRKYQERRTAAGRSDLEVEQEVQQVQSMLQKHLPKKVQMRGCSFKAYLAALPACGGLIQAVPRQAGCPTVHFTVSAEGETEVLGTSESVAPFAPVRRLPADGHADALHACARAVGGVMAERGIRGFASVDCVVTEDEELHVVDVDLRLTQATEALLCVLFMTRTTFDHDCLRSADAREAPSLALVTSTLHMPSMPQTYNRLFEVFRQAKSSFALLENVGMILLHADTRGKQLALGIVAKAGPRAVANLLAALTLFESAEPAYTEAIAALRGAGSRSTGMRRSGTQRLSSTMR